MDDKRPKKRSLTLKGHRTSVSLEDAFWKAFRKIAAQQGKPINVLAAEIDAARGLEPGLASAIRLFVLAWYQERVDGRGPGAISRPSPTREMSPATNRKTAKTRR